MENLIDIGLNLMHSSFRKDRVEIIEEAKKVGVTQFIITGTNLHSSQIAAEYASKYPGVLYSTSGVHPHDAEEFSGDTAPFEEMLLDSKVRAVGEIGLDYFYDLSPRDIQRNTFEKFLTLALQHRKVVCVHCRDQENRFDAYTDCYDMLKDFAAAAGEG